MVHGRAAVCDQMGLACLGESNCRAEFVAELGIGACFTGASVCVVLLGTGAELQASQSLGSCSFGDVCTGNLVQREDHVFQGLVYGRVGHR